MHSSAFPPRATSLSKQKRGCVRDLMYRIGWKQTLCECYIQDEILDWIRSQS